MAGGGRFVGLLFVGLLCGVGGLVVVLLTYTSDRLTPASAQAAGAVEDWKTPGQGEYSQSSTAAMVERDVHRCKQVYFQSQKPGHIPSTPSFTAAANHFNLFKEFLPPGQSYLLNFKNPCWYSDLTIRNNITGPLSLTKILNIDVFKEKSSYTFSGGSTTEVGNVDLIGHSGKQLYCVPKFYLAGFPKTGSSSLYDFIIQHPDVAKPVVKEGHFWRTFAYDNHGNFDAKRLQILWFLKHFSSAVTVIEKNAGAITLDASVSTLWDNAGNSLDRDEDICLVPSLVLSIYPQARFIVLMRDPVQRLFSDFWYICGSKKMKRDVNHAPQLFHELASAAVNDFKKCVADGVSEFECTRLADYSTTNYHHRNNSCYDVRLGIGLYYFHIAKWLNVLPIEQFLFLTSEDLWRDADIAMRRVWFFMGLKPVRGARFNQQSQSQPRNKNWYHQGKYKDKVYMLPETASMLYDFYRPHNERLAVLLKDVKYSRLWSGK